MENSGEVQVYNTAKQEAEQIVFPILMRHVNATRQARTGEIPDISLDKISKNKRKLNRVKALHLIISSQKDLIQIARPNVRHKAINDWERKYNDKERIENTFEKSTNDYNSLGELRAFLDFLEKEIIRADKSATKDDDFLIDMQGVNGIDSELTQNFYEMFRELEEVYEKVYTILIKHKLVSAGISEDESASYKELEEEGIKRITEA